MEHPTAYKTINSIIEGLRPVAGAAAVVGSVFMLAQSGGTMLPVVVAVVGGLAVSAQGLTASGNIQELWTGDNWLLEGAFDGNRDAYNAVSIMADGTVAIIGIGSAIYAEQQAINAARQAHEAAKWMGQPDNFWNQTPTTTSPVLDFQTPTHINFDPKQLETKYGEHLKDYPEMKGYTDYREYAKQIF